MTITQSTSTKQDILNYLLKKGKATALELAKVLDVSPQAIRRHLKDLGSEALIDYEVIQPKMGRPQYIFKLSRQGRDRFGQRYGQFAVSFLNTLAETVGEDQVKSILQKQWERKALEYRDFIGSGCLGDRVNKLVELRRHEGYMAELHLVNSEKYILAEHNCAISEVAESYPSVCGHELEMFSAVLPDCIVERTHWINNGEHRCGYLIQAKPS